MGMVSGVVLALVFNLNEIARAGLSVIIVSLVFYATYRVWPKRTSASKNEPMLNTKEDEPKT